MTFPGGKRFAFSILDDTDDSTLENVKPIYDLLRERGLRTTKTVWPLDCPEGSRHFFAADTLQNKAYRDFVHEIAIRFVLQGIRRKEVAAPLRAVERPYCLRGTKPALPKQIVDR